MLWTLGFLRFFVLTAPAFRIIVGFIKIFVSLLIVSKNIAEFFGCIYSFIVIVAESNDRCVFFHHANEYCSVTMPPSVVINQFFTIGINNHSPAETVIPFASFFIAVRSVRTVQC